MISLLIADDHQIILDGFESIFKDDADIHILATALNGLQVLDILNTERVDVAILDINMPDLNGVELCKKITKNYPEIKVIALSMYKRQSYIQRMLQYGAKGYLLKDDSSEEIRNAILTVMNGENYFSSQIEPSLLLFGKIKEELPAEVITPRETKVLQLISQGYTNPEIANELFISHHTAESHRKNLIAKLAAKNTADLVRIALEKGLI